MRDIKDLIYKTAALSGEYPDFDVAHVPDNPLDTFYEWFRNAVDSNVLEASVFVLSTVNDMGVPSARVVNLRDMTEDAFVIGSNSESQKGMDMSDNPNVTMTFYWPEVGRQIRVVGVAEAASLGENQADFVRRHPHSKALSIIAKQSMALCDVGELDREMADASRLVESDNEIYKTWTLYKIRPSEIEFFQARKDLAHIRLKYKMVDGDWSHGLLYP